MAQLNLLTNSEIDLYGSQIRDTKFGGGCGFQYNSCNIKSKYLKDTWLMVWWICYNFSSVQFTLSCLVWLLNPVRVVCDGCKADVKIRDMIGNWFNIEQRVGQGCLMSPWLLHIFMDNIFKKLYGDLRILFRKMKVYVHSYAIDATLLDKNRNHLS